MLEEVAGEREVWESMTCSDSDPDKQLNMDGWIAIHKELYIDIFISIVVFNVWQLNTLSLFDFSHQVFVVYNINLISGREKKPFEMIPYGNFILSQSTLRAECVCVCVCAIH